MEITPWTVYLWQLADGLKVGSGILVPAFLIASFVFKIREKAKLERWELATKWFRSPHYHGSSGRNEFEKWLTEDMPQDAPSSPSSMLCFMGACLCFFLAIMLPSSKAVALIKVVPDVVESKAVQKDLPEVYDMALKALKEQLTKEKK